MHFTKTLSAEADGLVIFGKQRYNFFTEQTDSGDFMDSSPFYLISLPQLRRLGVSKCFRVTDLFYVFSDINRSGRFCEFNFIQEGALLETCDGVTERYEAGTVHTTIFRDNCCHHSGSEPVHVFETGIVFSEPCRPMTEEDVLHWIPRGDEMLLCRRVDDPKVVGELEKHIKTAISCYSSGRRDRYAATWAELVQIMGIMTAHALVQAQQNRSHRPRINELCQRACNYVTENLSQPILEREAADALGVASSYLSRIFSQSMGMTLTEYVHRAKLQHVVHLFLDTDADLRTAADAVGIASTKHLSRLFRQYMGMSITEYKKLHSIPLPQTSAPREN